MFSANILVVEGDEINQQLIQIILENKGLKVAIVSNGAKAIEYITKLNDRNLDFILVNINIPLVDGLNTTKKIKKYEIQNNLQHIPIIELTTNLFAEYKEKYIQLGIDNYISKHVKNSELYKLLDLYLKKAKMETSITNCNLQNYSFEETSKHIGISITTFINIFTKFINTLQKNIEELECFIKNNKFKEIANLSHKLKGSSGNMRLTILSDIFHSIEVKARKKEILRYINELYEIREIHKQLQKTLKKNQIS